MSMWSQNGVHVGSPRKQSGYRLADCQWLAVVTPPLTYCSSSFVNKWRSVLGIEFRLRSVSNSLPRHKDPGRPERCVCTKTLGSGISVPACYLQEVQQRRENFQISHKIHMFIKPTSRPQGKLCYWILWEENSTNSLGELVAHIRKLASPWLPIPPKLPVTTFARDLRIFRDLHTPLVKWNPEWLPFVSQLFSWPLAKV